MDMRSTLLLVVLCASMQELRAQTIELTNEQKWWMFRSIMELEKKILLDPCRVDESRCTPEAKYILSLAGEVRGLPKYEALQIVNKRINEKKFGIPSAQLSQTWAVATTVLAVGKGDCKHYAIVKYTVLSESGFPTEDIGVVLGTRQTYHAVLRARVGNAWFFLDNLSNVVAEEQDYIEILNFQHRVYLF
jgi:predicted transglutaminase-like cysteine proteinase